MDVAFFNVCSCPGSATDAGFGCLLIEFEMSSTSKEGMA
jgi:hypothetical protein